MDIPNYKEMRGIMSNDRELIEKLKNEFGTIACNGEDVYFVTEDNDWNIIINTVKASLREKVIDAGRKLYRNGEVCEDDYEIVEAVVRDFTRAINEVFDELKEDKDSE